MLCVYLYDKKNVHTLYVLEYVLPHVVALVGAPLPSVLCSH